MSTNRPPACDHAYKNFKPLDKRMARGGYAPGEYFVKCRKCECGFTGDKRAYECADCAYAGSNRPPSCDLPPEFYQVINTEIKPCPFCESVYVSNSDEYVTCHTCHTYGPDNDWSAHRWNSIPRRSEVLELLWRAQNVLDNPMPTELEHLSDYTKKLRKEIGE